MAQSAIGQLLANNTAEGGPALSATNFSNILTAHLIGDIPASTARDAINALLAMQGLPPLTAQQETDMGGLVTHYNGLTTTNKLIYLAKAANYPQYLQNSQNNPPGARLSIETWDTLMGIPQL